MGTVFGLALVVVWLVVVGGLAWSARYTWLAARDTSSLFGGHFGHLISITLACFGLVLFTGGAAVVTGDLDFGSVPDGCYRISTTTSTSMAVIPGKTVTVVPITSSGRTYTPIACPA